MWPEHVVHCCLKCRRSICEAKTKNFELVVTKRCSKSCFGYILRCDARTRIKELEAAAGLNKAAPTPQVNPVAHRIPDMPKPPLYEGAKEDVVEDRLFVFKITCVAVKFPKTCGQTMSCHSCLVKL